MPLNWRLDYLLKPGIMNDASGIKFVSRLTYFFGKCLRCPDVYCRRKSLYWSQAFVPMYRANPIPRPAPP